MTLAVQPLVLTPHEVVQGSARRDCTWCKAPLIINTPSILHLLRDLGSPTARLGMSELTRTEQVIFNALYLRYPNGVEMERLLTELQGVTPGSLRVYLNRIRPKLRPHGWLIRVEHGIYRLVIDEPEEVSTR